MHLFSKIFNPGSLNCFSAAIICASRAKNYEQMKSSSDPQTGFISISNKRKQCEQQCDRCFKLRELP